MTNSINLEKYKKLKEAAFYRKKGKVVNVVGLTIESAGPNAKMGDVMRHYRSKGCRGMGAVCAKLPITDLRVQNLFRRRSCLPI